MELVLIRHGLPVRVDRGSGPADPRLSAEGHAQAEALAAWWAPHGIDALYASPMRRARETAAPLATRLGHEVVIDEGLQEFDADSRFYVPLEEMRADEARWQEVVQEWSSPEAEAGRREFRGRVVDTVESIVARHRSQRVGLVCHGGVINAYLSDVVQIEATLFFEPAYTSFSRVLAGPGRRQLVSANEAPHLGRPVVPASGG